MADTAIIVIGGSRILTNKDSEYERKHREWEMQCSSVRARFKIKTSRTRKNGKEYESTNWYEEQPGGGLKSVGKEEPDYKKYYPPEPKPSIVFKYQEYDGHVLLKETDYNANQALFRDNLAFRLEECRNLDHPLYRNPQKAVDSVRTRGGISARSPERTGQNKDNSCKTEKDGNGMCIVLTGMGCEVLCCKECRRETCNSRCRDSPGPLGTKKREPAQIDDGCLGDGDCDECEHSDECPVMAEEEEI